MTTGTTRPRAQEEGHKPRRSEHTPAHLCRRESIAPEPCIARAPDLVQYTEYTVQCIYLSGLSEDFENLKKIGTIFVVRLP